MSATIEQAAAWFEERAKTTPMPGAREMFEIAAAALREKAERENHKPLTLEELRQMDGKPVYVVSASRTGSGWVIFDCHNDDGFGMCDETWYFAKSYGKAWIAYRHKPKEVTK